MDRSASYPTGLAHNDLTQGADLHSLIQANPAIHPNALVADSLGERDGATSGADSLPRDASVPAFAPDLFNTEEYARLHAARFGGIGVRSEHIRPGRDTPDGVFQAMQIRPGVFASPGRGPYGGFDVSDDMDEAELADFVATTETKLRSAGAQQVELVMPPFCYGPHSGPRCLAVLCRSGYRVTRQELNQAIVVTEASLAERGNYENRKRLNKAARAGLSVRHMDAIDYQAAYSVILENRLKKGRSLSMSWQDVQAMIVAFPQQVYMFGAQLEDRTIAAAICLAVNRRVLYVYAWGECEGAESVSPVSSIAAYVYKFAQQHGFALLDLGTSSVDGIVNPGLVRFKRSLGATTSLKLWMGKSLG